MITTLFSLGWRFVAKYWPIILAVVIFGYCLYKYNSATDARDKAINELAAFKQAIAIKVREQEIENVIKLQIAKTEVVQATSTHTKQIEAIKNDYAKRNKVNVDTIANLRNELRSKLENSKFRVPESTSDTSQHSKGERECNAAYSTLEDACKLTTSDFNVLRSWADTVCGSVGCEASR